MIGGSGGVDLSKYLVNFNSSAWANQANAQLQAALSQGLKYSQAYSQQATKAVQDYNKQAQQQQQQGFAQSQKLNAPQRFATYNALDAYQRSLGLPTPVGGSANLAGSPETFRPAPQPAAPQTGGLFAPQEGVPQGGVASFNGVTGPIPPGGYQIPNNVQYSGGY